MIILTFALPLPPRCGIFEEGGDRCIFEHHNSTEWRWDVGARGRSGIAK